MQAAMLSSLSKNGSCLELALVTANVGSIFENVSNIGNINIILYKLQII